MDDKSVVDLSDSPADAQVLDQPRARHSSWAMGDYTSDTEDDDDDDFSDDETRTQSATQSSLTSIETHALRLSVSPHPLATQQDSLASQSPHPNAIKPPRTRSSTKKKDPRSAVAQRFEPGASDHLSASVQAKTQTPQQSVVRPKSPLMSTDSTLPLPPSSTRSEFMPADVASPLLFAGSTNSLQLTKVAKKRPKSTTKTNKSGKKASPKTKKTDIGIVSDTIKAKDCIYEVEVRARGQEKDDTTKAKPTKTDASGGVTKKTKETKVTSTNSVAGDKENTSVSNKAMSTAAETTKGKKSGTVKKPKETTATSTKRKLPTSEPSKSKKAADESTMAKKIKSKKASTEEGPTTVGTDKEIAKISKKSNESASKGNANKKQPTAPGTDVSGADTKTTQENTKVKSKRKITSQADAKSCGSSAKPPAKKKKLNLQDRIYRRMLMSCKPYNLKSLSTEVELGETALNHILLSLIDKKLVIKKDFTKVKKETTITKTLYWANQDAECIKANKEVSAGLVSREDIVKAQEELKRLQHQEASIRGNLAMVLKEPSNQELAENLSTQEKGLAELREKLEGVKKRIQSGPANATTGPIRKGPGLLKKPAPVCTNPKELKQRINKMRDEWKKRKEKNMDFIDQLADGLEKKPKDVIKLLDVITDESEGVTMPPKYSLS